MYQGNVLRTAAGRSAVSTSACLVPTAPGQQQRGAWTVRSAPSRTIASNARARHCDASCAERGIPKVTAGLTHRRALAIVPRRLRQPRSPRSTSTASTRQSPYNMSSVASPHNYGACASRWALPIDRDLSLRPERAWEPTKRTQSLCRALRRALARGQNERERELQRAAMTDKGAALRTPGEPRDSTLHPKAARPCTVHPSYQARRQRSSAHLLPLRELSPGLRMALPI